MDPAQALEASMLAQQQPMLAAMAQGESDVQRFYKNSVVFLTGGSGFLGKQLLEKLLRSCQISKVYMLLRPKKGKDTHERIEEMIQDPVFDTLLQQQTKFSSKLIAVEGDISKVKLGMKDADWKILTEEVDVIFHMAATTRFDESLRTATLINVRGTREALLLGKACKKLRSYVHVSSAYSHATTHRFGGEVKEEFYRTPVPPDTLISMAENVETDILNNITVDLIKGWPNTYTFTKAVSEELVRTTSTGLPVCIMRPAMILSTYREPSPGWLDISCLYGVSGMTFGGGMGVVHVFYTNTKAKTGFIPCDYVNNAIIVAAKETAANQSKGGDDTKIYTVSSTHRNPVTIGRVFADILKYEGINYTSPRTIYYIFLLFTSNKYMFAVLSFFLHIIPAYIADFVCLIIGKERRFAKLAKKMYKLCSIMGHFALNEWNFVDDNLNKLYSGLSKQDQAIYNFDVTDIDWRQYFLMVCVGLRKYILKDGLNGTENAVKKQKYLKIAHYIFMIFYVYCIWKFIYLIYLGGGSLISALIK